MSVEDPRTVELVDCFASCYGGAPAAAVRAPGRVNLIGEHTDYNDGFCLPMAIERDVRIALRARDDRTVRVASVQEGGAPVAFTIDAAIGKDPAAPWADYVKGCAQILHAEGLALRGCDLALTGDVPLGSGLSSSAALEVATIHALLVAAGLALDDARIATLAQRAENTYVGTNCGILDQLSSACGMRGRAMLMDCRTQVLHPVPLPDDIAVVIADTGKRRGLVDSAYNERRQQCEAGAAALGVSHLRDVDLHALRAAAADRAIDAETLRRCQHVVAENGRTLAAAACLRAGDPVALGALMDASHADLRDRFQVTCAELDVMTAIARSLDGCLGSRMTGAGFGGCTVSLVRAHAVDAFVPALERAYGQRFDLPVAVYVTRAAAGAGRLPME